MINLFCRFRKCLWWPLSSPIALSSWCGDILISSSSLVGVSFASIFFTWFSTKDIGWLCLKTHAFSSVPLLRTHEKHHSLSQFLNVIYSQFIISANRSKQMVQVIFNFDLLHMNNGHTPFTPTATNVYLCHATDRQSDKERKRERDRGSDRVKIGIGTSVAHWKRGEILKAVCSKLSQKPITRRV